MRGGTLSAVTSALLSLDVMMELVSQDIRRDTLEMHFAKSPAIRNFAKPPAACYTNTFLNY